MDVIFYYMCLNERYCVYCLENGYCRCCLTSVYTFLIQRILFQQLKKQDTKNNLNLVKPEVVISIPRKSGNQPGFFVCRLWKFYSSYHPIFIFKKIFFISQGSFRSFIVCIKTKNNSNHIHSIENQAVLRSEPLSAAICQYQPIFDISSISNQIFFSKVRLLHRVKRKFHYIPQNHIRKQKKILEVIDTKFNRMALPDSPSHFTNGYEEDPIFQKSHYTQDISEQMRVPKRIRATGEVYDDFDNMHGGMNGWHNSQNKIDMTVPDRIMVMGQDQHFGK